MRRKMFDRNALTLTELLMTTAIVGIIMLGVVSVDYALRKQNRSSYGSLLSLLGAQSIAQRVITEATKAVGTSADPGIVVGSQTGGPGPVRITDVNTFCIRRDMKNTPTSWVCYWRSTTLADTVTGMVNFYTCTKSLPAGSVIGQGCSSADTNLGPVVKVVASFDKFVSTTTPGLQKLLFTVTVTVTDRSSKESIRSVTASVSPLAQTI